MSPAPRQKPLASATHFIRQYIKSPQYVGAIMASGKSLCHCMAKAALSHISKQSPTPYMVELGAGTGVVTDALLKLGTPAERLISIENNHTFTENLQKKFPNINLHKESAEELSEILQSHSLQQVPVIISSLPLRSLPEDVKNNILLAIRKCLNDDGLYIQFSYGLRSPVDCDTYKFRVIKKKFIACNMPPAFVWQYKKQL